MRVILIGSARIVLLTCADVAQLVEQLIRNQQVIGSSPIAGSSSLRNPSTLQRIFADTPAHVSVDRPFDTGPEPECVLQ